MHGQCLLQQLPHCPLCLWVQLSDNQQLELCHMCTSVQAVCFMQGFLPHPNSKEFKYHMVIAKLHDATFAEVVRSFYCCLCDGYWIKDSQSARPLALNTPQLPAPFSPCNKNLSWATENVSILKGTLLSDRLVTGSAEVKSWPFFFPLGFFFFGLFFLSFHICLMCLLMGIVWDS